MIYSFTVSVGETRPPGVLCLVLDGLFRTDAEKPKKGSAECNKDGQGPRACDLWMENEGGGLFYFEDEAEGQCNSSLQQHVGGVRKIKPNCS